jgi:hypothetical protein
MKTTKLTNSEITLLTTAAWTSPNGNLVSRKQFRKLLESIRVPRGLSPWKYTQGFEQFIDSIGDTPQPSKEMMGWFLGFALLVIRGDVPCPPPGSTIRWLIEQVEAA